MSASLFLLQRKTRAGSIGLGSALAVVLFLMISSAMAFLLAQHAKYFVLVFFSLLALYPVFLMIPSSQEQFGDIHIAAWIARLISLANYASVWVK